MDREHIKHVPVVRAEHLVGIVSRADIVRALILRPDNSHGPMSNDDDIIRARVIEALIAIPGASAWLTEVDVDQGVVTLSGMVQDEAVLDSSRKVVADIPYVTAVKDHRAVPQSTWG
jgi:CBS domain-containing protein